MKTSGSFGVKEPNSLCIQFYKTYNCNKDILVQDIYTSTSRREYTIELPVYKVIRTQYASLYQHVGGSCGLGTRWSGHAAFHIHSMAYQDTDSDYPGYCDLEKKPHGIF